MHAVLTSARGDVQRVVTIDELARKGAGPAATLCVNPLEERQTVLGIGTSLTQASAVALSSLTAERRREVLEMVFGPRGAAFSMIRTHVGSCDFSAGNYCYAPEPDPSLRGFSLDVDRENGHLELLREGHAVEGASFRTIASPWTAPPWMKDNGRYFDPERHRGGRLLPEHSETFARYMAAYVEAMAAEGVDVWGLTPVNEPHGNRGTWESMEMSPEEQAEYVAVLGRVLAERGLDPKLLVYDQNRAEMRSFVEPIFGHAEAGKHAFGAAVHWYDSTFRVFEDELEALHAAWPDRPIIQTEGCIDNVFSHGEFKGPGAETPWWENDAWYWEKVATDWGWDWAPNPEVDHPPYAAAFRYARDLVGCLAHRVSGWVDWNLALTRRGGPNHVENFCLAPLLVDGEQLHVTPLFHVLAQISRSTRPGAVVLGTNTTRPGGLWSAALRGPGGERVLHLFNETDDPVEISVAWADDSVPLRCPAATLMTVDLG